MLTPSNASSFAEFVLSMDPLDIGLLSASYISRNVLPLLASVASTEFQKAWSSVWGFVGLFVFAVVVLRTPSSHSNHCCHFLISSVLLDHLHVWSLSNGFKSLVFISRWYQGFKTSQVPFKWWVFGLVRAGTAMLFKHFIQQVIIMMMVHSKTCLGTIHIRCW